MWRFKTHARYSLIDFFYLKFPFSYYRRIASLIISSFCTVVLIAYFAFGITVAYPMRLLAPKLNPLLPLEPYKLMKTYNQSLSVFDHQPSHNLIRPLDDDKQFKKILFWNEAYGGKTYDIGLGRDVFRQAGCPVWQCSSTDDRKASQHEEFDAVVFHQRSW